MRSIEWTVHLASKKAAWYNFSELEGDLMLGPDNNYQARKVPLRNSGVTGADRQMLLIDFGPRTLGGPGARSDFTKDSVPPGYPAQYPKKVPSQGEAINSLGEAMVDAQGRLIVLGAFGKAGGDQPITSFAGADTWHDDISDGPIRCKLTLADGTVQELKAWVIVGSPKFAPELVNIVTLDDIMFDVGVRYYNLAPGMYDPRRWPATGGWNPDYEAHFERDIEPLIKRPAGYQWVANVPSMTAFSMPPFDPRDNSPSLLAARRTYLSYWRKPGSTEVAGDGQENVLLSPSGVPMMPLNSGTNSVSNTLIDKFLCVTLTKYFLLGQWAEGKFKVGAADDLPLHPLDRASIGNAVGSPMCPGIEVTWSARNPAIYAAPYVIAHDRLLPARPRPGPRRDRGGELPARRHDQAHGHPLAGRLLPVHRPVHQLHQPLPEQERCGHPGAADLLRILVAPAEPHVRHDADHGGAGATGYRRPGQLPGLLLAGHQHLRGDDLGMVPPRVRQQPQHRAGAGRLPRVRGGGAQPRQVHRLQRGGGERGQFRKQHRQLLHADVVPAERGGRRRADIRDRPGRGGPAFGRAAQARSDDRHWPPAPEHPLMRADVLIVGGGPAGTAAALALRHYSRLEAVVLERGDYREPRVGETIGPGVRPLLAYLGVEAAFEAGGHRRAYASAAAWGTDQVFTLDFLLTGRGDGWHLDRNRFDRSLADAAREAGATVLTGTRIADVRRDDDRWRVRAVPGDGAPIEIEARFLVEAGGRSAAVARGLGAVPQPSDQLTGVIGFVDFDPPWPEASVVLVEAVPEGWWYSAPLPDNRLAVVFMSDADLIQGLGAQALDGWLPALAQAPRTRPGRRRAASRSAPGPAGRLPGPAPSGRRRVAGLRRCGGVPRSPVLDGDRPRPGIRSPRGAGGGGGPRSPRGAGGGGGPPRRPGAAGRLHPGRRGTVRPIPRDSPPHLWPGAAMAAGAVLGPPDQPGRGASPP